MMWKQSLTATKLAAVEAIIMDEWRSALPMLGTIGILRRLVLVVFHEQLAVGMSPSEIVELVRRSVEDEDGAPVYLHEAASEIGHRLNMASGSGLH